VPAKGRDTMGVVFAKFADDDRIIGLARNTERNLETSVIDGEEVEAEVATTDTAPESTEE